jgi:hypothetical protein
VAAIDLEIALLQNRTPIKSDIAPKHTRQTALANHPNLQGEKLNTQVIPFRRNKSAFERVKAPGFNDRNWVNIKSILTQLRSLNPGSFHAAQMRIYFSEMVLFKFTIERIICQSENLAISTAIAINIKLSVFCRTQIGKQTTLFFWPPAI